MSSSASGFRRRLVAASLTAVLAALPVKTAAQSVLFDFQNAPQNTSLPIDQTAGGITAHFSSTGVGGYAIWPANFMGFTPVGFADLAICPSAVYAADLLVAFSEPIRDFSIVYAAQELACDTSSTLEVRGYAGATLVGSNTMSAVPGATWPSATLTLTAAQGFDNVVVHYMTAPPLPCDYGVIFMADNMQVTPLDPIFANGFD